LLAVQNKDDYSLKNAKTKMQTCYCIVIRFTNYLRFIIKMSSMVFETWRKCIFFYLNCLQLTSWLQITTKTKPLQSYCNYLTLTITAVTVVSYQHSGSKNISTLSIPLKASVVLTHSIF